MTSKERLIEALRRLCARTEGGVEAVADRAKLSAESLKQVLAGTKLPKSGNPRGVGPTAQKALAMAFPGWDEAPAPRSSLVDEIAAVVAQLAPADQRRVLMVAESYLPEPVDASDI